MAQAAVQHESVGVGRAREGWVSWLLIGTGIVALIASYLMFNSIGERAAAANVWVRNLGPVVGLLGVILVGEGIILQQASPKQVTSWLMVYPAIVVILLVVIFPTIYALGLSFVRWDVQIQERPFIFVENYVTLLTDNRVWGALQNTATIAGGAVVLQLILGVGLALLLRDPFPGRATVISIVIIPMMMAPIVVGQTFRMLWDARFGAINHLLSLITGQDVLLLWLSRPRLAITAIVITDVWQWTPFIFLITLAGMLSINNELYEVASIDGASAWTKFWRITLPLLRPVLLVAVLFRLLDALKIFDIVYILTNGGPGYTTENFSFYLYQQGISYGRFGYSAAGAIVFLAVVVAISMFLIRRVGER